jgi:Laminin G domain
MRKRMLAAAVALATIGLASPAQALTTIGDWQMNEPAGSTVMVDSSGNGLNGTIGTSVQVGYTNGGATGYNWTYRPPSSGGVDKQRIVQVNSSTLNPDTSDYAVELRFRTLSGWGNIVQKGQAAATGGYWKIENPGGHIECKYRGKKTDGTWGTKVVRSANLNDGAWHTVRCVRLPTTVTLTVDGVLYDTARGKTGSISNTGVLSIGGKLNCQNQPGQTSCDYYTGSLDYVRIEKG